MSHHCLALKYAINIHTCACAGMHTLACYGIERCLGYSHFICVYMYVCMYDDDDCYLFALTLVPGNFPRGGLDPRLLMFSSFSEGLHSTIAKA